MTPLNQFYQYTIELIELFEKASLERDSKIASTEELLEKRELLMKEIKGPFSQEEKDLYMKILGLNERLEQLMSTEKLYIQKDIKELNQKKESNSKYSNPYESLNTDGIFYDKRN